MLPSRSACFFPHPSQCFSAIVHALSGSRTTYLNSGGARTWWYLTHMHKHILNIPPLHRRVPLFDRQSHSGESRLSKCFQVLWHYLSALHNWQPLRLQKTSFSRRLCSERAEQAPEVMDVLNGLKWKIQSEYMWKLLPTLNGKHKITLTVKGKNIY